MNHTEHENRKEPEIIKTSDKSPPAIKLGPLDWAREKVS